MPNDPNAPFFELGYARSLSRRLRSTAPHVGAPAAAESEKQAEGPRFMRFSRTEALRDGNSFDAAAVGESLRAMQDVWGDTAWHALLDGCVEATGASGAFAIDDGGLVIATRGDIDPELAEHLGARLSITLDQTARMGETSGVVCVELDERWLTGLRNQAQKADVMTVGVLSKEPPALTARRAITVLLNALGEARRAAGER